MLTAAFWAAVGSSALVVGAVIGFFEDLPMRVVGLVMGFGAGTLLSAVSFDLVLESYREADGWAIFVGLLLGALVFWAGDWALEKFTPGGEDPVVGETVSGTSLVFGAALDGIPESVAIGLTILAGGSVSVAMVVAVFLSNVPEGMAAAVGLRRAGHSRARILWLFVGVVAMCVVAAAVGYTLLGGASPDAIALIQAFAAGAILALLAITLMPEAYAHGGREVGLVTALGFIFASALATAG